MLPDSPLNASRSSACKVSAELKIRKTITNPRQTSCLFIFAPSCSLAEHHLLEIGAVLQLSQRPSEWLIDKSDPCRFML
jgi:hypothetical protein